MSEQQFDDFTRSAAGGISRRGTLATLGGAALAAATLANPLRADAKQDKSKKKIKKLKKKNKQKAAQQCETQVDECNASIQTRCAQLGGAQAECLAVLTPCCTLMEDCNVGLGVTCIAQFIG